MKNAQLRVTPGGWPKQGQAGPLRCVFLSASAHTLCVCKVNTKCNRHGRPCHLLPSSSCPATHAANLLHIGWAFNCRVWQLVLAHLLQSSCSQQWLPVLQHKHTHKHKCSPTRQRACLCACAAPVHTQMFKCVYMCADEAQHTKTKHANRQRQRRTRRRTHRHRHRRRHRHRHKHGHSHKHTHAHAHTHTDT